MQDKETGSEWSHMLGEAKAGSLKGKSLEIIPSVMTNWNAWLESHPDTTATVVEATAFRFRTEMLRNAREFGLGLVRAGEARFWRFDRLQQSPLINERFAGMDLVVYFDVPNRTPTAWNRRTSDQLLTFEATAQGVQDVETKSNWDLLRGVSTKGPLEAKQLEAIPAIVSFTGAWERFHPESSQWKPK